MPGTPRRTLEGVFAPTVLALLPAAPLVALPLVGWSGTANLLTALGLAAIVSVGTALGLAAAATDAPPGAHPARTILGRSLGRGVGAAVVLPAILTRPSLAAFALLAVDHLGGSLLTRSGGLGIGVDVGLLIGVALLAGLAPGAIAKARLAAAGVLASSLLLALVGALFAGWDPAWVPTADLDPELVLSLAVPALMAPIGGADGTAVLTDPRRSFPAGTLWAGALALVLALVVTADPAAFQIAPSPSFPSVVARVGLIATLLWTAAASLRGAAEAIGEALTERWLPGSVGPNEAVGAAPWASAVAVAGMLVVVGDLGAVAWALSVLLLLTAVGVNLAVLVPLWLRLPSFRPTVRLPLWVPASALLAAGFALAVLAPTTAVAGLVVMGALYLRGERTAERADERSALLAALLTRATATDAAQEAPRAWTPRIVVPLADAELSEEERTFLVEAVRPEGALHLLGVAADASAEEALEGPLDDLATSLRADGVAATRAVVTAATRSDGAAAALQVLQGTFPAPGLVYVRQPEPDPALAPELRRLVATARRARVGVYWLDLHPESALGARRAVNLWVRPHVDGWETREAFALGHVDLALLTCLRLQRNLGMRVTLVAAVPSPEDLPRAHAFLGEIATLGRLPAHATRTVAVVGELAAALTMAPPADLHVLGLPPDPDPGFARQLRDAVGASVLLVAGSGRESARA